jgi:hypothetical protein
MTLQEVEINCNKEFFQKKSVFLFFAKFLLVFY